MAQTSEDKTAPESFLIVQHSTSAALSDGVLTLDGADKHAIVFADRPHRAAGAIPSAQLIQNWDEGADSFASDPPNAALVGEHDGQPVSLIVELTNPKLAEGNIKFDYKLIEGVEVPEISQAYVVIDDCFSCLGDVMNYAVGNPMGFIINPNDH
jgi:hypothetical protein